MSDAALRVLYVSHACLLRANRYVLDLLAASGDLDIHLLAPEGARLSPGCWQECEPHDGRYGFTSLPKLTEHVRTHLYRGFGALVKRLQPRVIHLDYEAGSLAAWQARRADRSTPLVCTSYENIDRDFAAEARRALRAGQTIRAALLWGLHCLEHAMITQVTCLVALNPEAIQIYRRKGFRGDAQLVPLGINTDVFRPLDSRELRQQLGLRGFVVGYIGRLNPQKGLDLLIQAASQIQGEFCLLVDAFEQYSNPSYRRQLMEMARENGVADRTVFFDAAHAEMPRYMNCLDCLVLPSRTTPTWKEQYGRVLIEAMACGVPVVGSSSGNIPHVIGQDGLLFPEGDARALASALQHLQANPEFRRDLARRGREKAVRQYSCQTQCRLLLDIYRNLSSRRPAAA